MTIIEALKLSVEKGCRIRHDRWYDSRWVKWLEKSAKPLTREQILSNDWEAEDYGKPKPRPKPPKPKWT